MKKITDVRQDLGINQTTLAVLLGCSRSHIAMVESTGRKLDIASLEKLSTLSKTVSSYSVSYASEEVFTNMQKQEIESMLRAAKHKEEKISIEYDKLVEKYTKIIKVQQYQNAVASQEGDNLDLQFRLLIRNTTMTSTKMCQRVSKMYLNLIAQQAVVNELHDVLMQYDYAAELDNIIDINVGSSLQYIQ